MPKKTQRTHEPIDTSILRRDLWRVPNAPSDRHYRWARDNPHRIQELKYYGYRIAQGDDPEVVTDPEDPAHVHIEPDTKPPAPPEHILMYIPQELHKRRDQAKEEVLRQHERSIEQKIDDVKRAIRDHGGRGSKMLAQLLSDQVDDDDLNF